MGTFALDLQRFAEKTKEKADDAVGLIVKNVAAELDKRSPVGDTDYWKNPPPKGYTGGRFRGNWQLGVGTIPSSGALLRDSLGRFRAHVDPTGAATQGRIIASIPGQAAGKVYYLVNNVPYARRIEEGWSRQAPQGLVGLTTVMFQQIVDEAVQGLPQ
jgi:hypothetical protein